MSINIGTLDIGVAFAGDTAGLQRATADAQQGIDRFGASTSRAMRQVREDTIGAEDALSRLQRGFDSVGQGAVGIGRSLAGIAGGLAGVLSVGEFIKAADAVTTLNNKLRLATGSTQAAGQAYEALFDIAQRSRVSFTELGGTFAAVSRAGQELGISQVRLLSVTESIGNAMTISGGNAESMKATLVQLGQGLASGTLRGEELNSVMEQTPRLAKALADGLGVPIGKLREMGAAGQITAQQVILALESQSSVLRGEVAGAVMTVGQAFTQLQNASVKTVGEFDKASGASKALADAISGLSTSVSGVGKAFADNEAAIKTTIGVLAGSGVAAAMARTATAMAGVATGVGGVAGAITVLKGVVAGLNPATLALLGIGAVMGAAAGYDSYYRGTQEGIKKTIADLEDANTRAATNLSTMRLSPEATAVVNKAIADRAAQIDKLRHSMIGLADAEKQKSFIPSGGSAERELAAANRKAAESYDDLRIRLSGFKGDYAKYQTDLKQIQSGMASGAIGQQEGVAMLTELAKKHGDVAKAAHARKPYEDALAESANSYGDAMKKLAGNSIDAESAANGYTKTQKTMLEIFSSSGFAGMPDIWKQTIVAEAEAKIAAEQLADANKVLALSGAEAAKVEQTRIDAAEKSAASVVGKLQALQDEEKALVIAAAQHISLAQAIEEVEIARLRERQAALMREGDRDSEVLAIQEEIDARKKLKAAIGVKETREAADKSAKEAAEAWKKASEQIEKDITDALMRGFESGKDFAMVLRDAVVNMFKTMVLRPVISAIVNPLAGAVTGSLGLAGTANAATGAANLLGGLGSIGSIGGMAESALINSGATYGTGFMSQQSAMLAAQEAGTLGAASSGVMSGLGAIGSTIGAFGTGMAASFTSAVSAGVGGWATAAGSLIGTGTSAGIAAGLGMVAAPLAAAALLWQPMFGRKLKDQGLQGEFGGEAGFTGENYQFYKGGWFRSDKTKTSPLDADMQSGLANQFKAIQLQTALMATALGDTGQSVADFTSSIKVSFNGLTEAQIGEKLTETFAGIANDLAQTVLGDSAFAKEGEAASQTLARLSTSLTTVNATFDTLGFSLEAISLTGADAASDFIDLIGGLENFTAATAGYYANFYTEAERQAKATEQLAAQLGKMGQTLPATRDGFRALVEAAEKAGDNALLAGLLNLQDEFAALTPTVEAAATAVAKANEQALASQSADRSAELAARRAAEAQAAEAMAETLRVYQEGAEQFDTLRQSLLLAGDAAGLLAATTERAFANPNGKYTAGGVQYDAPQWTETTTAAQFNYAYGVMAARLRRDLSDDLSANALRVQNVGPALSKLSVDNMLGQYDPVTGAAAQGIATALAEQVGSVASAAFGPVALAVAQRQTGTAYGAAGPGLASVFAAQRQASFDGNDDRAYSFALAALSETMRTGKLDAEQYATALDTLNSALPEAAAAFGNVEVQAARAAATAGAIGQAGLASIQYYFGQLGNMVEELAAAAAEAAEPIAQAGAAIGRFNSASTAFGLSARAALQLQNADETGQALLGASAGTISKSALIAEAAAIASGLVTTADAAKVQEQTGLSRDAALLIDGVRAYDAASLEKAFLRTSDALVKGTITEGEYATLFNTSLDIFQDVEAQSAELTRTFDALRDAAQSLADELLLDKNLSTLSGPQQLEEAQRQYRETLAAAFEGDAQAAQSLGGVAKTMLGIAQATAGNGTDYARIFGATVADARQLQAIQTPTLPVYQASQDETVRELRALREEVAALRADQREGLAQVASGTNTTAKRLNEWTNNGLPATETV